MNPPVIPSDSEQIPVFPQHQFVQWLRDVAPYVHTFHNKTFVIAFGGELIESGDLEDLVFDISLLKAMGMRIVLIPGARPQIEKQLALRQIPSEFVNGIRVTNAATLEAVKEACGGIAFVGRSGV